MRYLMLLVCLVSFTSAYAFNEVVSAIAYNPSRLGAYSYLKILQKASFKAGLGTTGNLTEINLYGNSITITDSQSNQKHKINVIKALSNYVVDGDDKTFSDSSSSWVKNNYANGGSNGPSMDFQNAWLTGESTTLWTAYNSTGEDAIPTSVPTIATVTMYGGTLQTSSSSSKKGFSVINQIKGLDLSSSSPTQKAMSALPNNFIKIDAFDATVDGSSITTTLYVTDTLTLKGMNIAASDLVCSSSSASYDWKERITDNHIKYKVLSRKCN